MYIIIEGIDTCGKSTQIELLKNKYSQIITTKEPHDVNIREMILNGSLTSNNAEMFLFLADRSEHFEKIIKPNLNQLIVSDRGFISGIAYAMMNKSSNIKQLIELNKIALSNQMPDLVILFNIDKQTLLSRISTKRQDNIEKRGIDYLLKIQDNMKIVLKMLNINYIEIDSKKTINEIHSIIIKTLENLS
jgi:dTMP kinase